MRRSAKADVIPVRQQSQFSCVSASTCMALNALGVECSEEQVNKVIGAKPMQGARWEEVLACAQYFGCRATLTTPATLTQVKSWTDQGKPVLIAWNPEGRDWSHASLIFDVTGERGSYVVHVADPNIPNPDKTVREVEEDEFYSKWFEKWPNYLVRRPALMIEKEIDGQGRQLMASHKKAFDSSRQFAKSASKTLFPCVSATTDLEDATLLEAVKKVPRGLTTFREFAVALADILEQYDFVMYDNSLSIIDVILKDLLNRMEEFNTSSIVSENNRDYPIFGQSQPLMLRRDYGSTNR